MAINRQGCNLDAASQWRVAGTCLSHQRPAAERQHPDDRRVYTGSDYLNDTWQFQPAGSTEKDPVHTYTAAGSYKVALQAYNGDGYDSLRKADYITVTTPAPASGTIIEQGAILFIGESGLNVTHALNQANSAADIDAEPALTSIGWWAPPSDPGTDAPSTTFALAGQYRAMTVNPTIFVSYPGNWYLLTAGGDHPVTTDPVFTIQDPSLDLRILDLDQGVADVTGLTAPQGDRLAFRIDTNMNASTDAGYRSPLDPATDGFVDIVVKNETDVVYTALYNNSPDSDPLLAGPFLLTGNYVDTQPYFWGLASDNAWQTDATDSGKYLYLPGTYTVWAESTLNHMRDNYHAGGGADWTGKTVSAQRTVTLTVTAPPASGTIIEQGAILFIGESGLNVTHALNQANSAADIDAEPSLTTIAWWAGGLGTDAPTTTHSLSGQYQSMLVDPAVFVSYPGTWYLLSGDGIHPVTMDPVFTVQDPALDIRILDLDQGVADVSGSTAPHGDRLAFRIDTNMNATTDASHRSPLDPGTDGFIDIVVKNETDVVYTALYNNSPDSNPLLAGPFLLTGNYVDTQPYFWGLAGDNAWQTDARESGEYLYLPGTYTVWAESTLNHMRDNYQAGGGADMTGKGPSLRNTR